MKTNVVNLEDLGYLTKNYLTAIDLMVMFDTRQEDELEFADWLMNLHKQGIIDNDDKGNFLTN